MHSLTSCCTQEGASQGFTPYQRLPRSRSTSSHPDGVPNAHTHHQDELKPNQLKSNSIDHNASSQLYQCEHNLVTDDYSSTSNDINLHSHTNFHPERLNDQAPSIVPSSSRQLHFNSVPCRIGNSHTFISKYNASQIQQGRSFNEPDREDVNTVLVKIGIIGDSGTGKTSFMAKYGGMELKNDSKDVVLLQKLCELQHVNIALHVWDLGGQCQYSNKMTMVCKDAAAIFIMFDLTRRSTLRSVKNWYLCARECNKVAMLVLIGTKYDGFVQMSKELQLAIIQEVSLVQSNQ